MAGIASTQTGNWSATTTWVGGVVPGSGDVATVSATHTVTVDVNTTIGPSGAGAYSVAGNRAIDIASTGNLIVATSTVFTVRGDVSINSTAATSVICAASSTWTFDTSVGGVIYGVLIGTGGSQTGATFQCNGNALQRVTVNSTGAAVGVFSGFADGNTGTGNFNSAFTDFTNIGNSTETFGNGGWWLSGAASGINILFNTCTFTNCGRLMIRASNNAANYQFSFNHWPRTASLNPIWIVDTTAPSGTRQFTNNVLATATAVWVTSKKAWTFDRNVMNGLTKSSLTNVGGNHTSAVNNLLYTRANTPSVSPFIWSTLSDTWVDNYHFLDVRSGEAIGSQADTTGQIGTITYTRPIYEATGFQEGSDAYQCPLPASGSYTILLDQPLILPNPRGRSSGNITMHGNKFLQLRLRHGTLMASETVNPSTTGMAAIYIGSTYTGHTAMVPELRDTLVWAKTQQAISGGWIAWHAATSRWTKGGTTTGETTSLRDTAPSPTNFTTAANQTPGDAGARLYLTGGTGSGDSRVVSSNSGTVATVSVAFSATPDGTTTYQMQGFDILTNANVMNNATYNMADGTVYDADGLNGVTVRGYTDLWQTTQALTATDITLTAGTNETTQGPKFVDSTRNMATYDSVKLGNSATAWAGTTSYVTGDFVSAATTSWYNGVTINYRSIIATTSGILTSPGIGTNWRAAWEFASVFRIREGILAGQDIGGLNYIADLHQWVRAGFAPQESTLNAASDGAWIGAVTGITSGGGGSSGGLTEQEKMCWRLV